MTTTTQLNPPLHTTFLLTVPSELDGECRAIVAALTVRCSKYYCQECSMSSAGDEPVSHTPDCLVGRACAVVARRTEDSDGR